MSATICQFALRLAVNGSFPADATPPAPRFEAAQGIVFALLRHTDPVRASALHEANERKALSISPITLHRLTGDLARAEVRIGVWEPELTSLLITALADAIDVPLNLGRLPAIVLDWQCVESWSVDQLLVTPPRKCVRVRFASPTIFGFGRHPSGAARVHRTPDPGPVVASWLRAWKLTGSTALDWLPSSPEALGDVLSLVELRDVRTTTVDERTARITGFLGDAAYQWEGTEQAGRQALATLARFAGICGTGAKTGSGFGLTEPLDPAFTRVSAPRIVADG